MTWKNGGNMKVDMEPENPRDLFEVHRKVLDEREQQYVPAL